MIATFELPYLNVGALNGAWKIEGGEVLSDVSPNLYSGMDNLGYNDSNLSNSMGTVYVITQVTVFGLIAVLITLPFIRCKKLEGINLWLRKKFLWNPVIRLVLEESLESTYAIVLCFKYSTFNKYAFGSAIDYILAVILAVAIASLPVFMLIFYLKNFDSWEDEHFDELYGAPLDGLHKKKKSSLFYPIYFVIRRVLFCLTTLFLFKYVII